MRDMPEICPRYIPEIHDFVFCSIALEEHLCEICPRYIPEMTAPTHPTTHTHTHSHTHTARLLRYLPIEAALPALWFYFSLLSLLRPLKVTPDLLYFD